MADGIPFHPPSACSRKNDASEPEYSLRLGLSGREAEDVHVMVSAADQIDADHTLIGAVVEDTNRSGDRIIEHEPVIGIGTEDIVEGARLEVNCREPELVTGTFTAQCIIARSGEDDVEIIAS